MFANTDPPSTSLPVLALTNLSAWVPEFPAMHRRPMDETVRGLAPTVIFIPTQPLKLLRIGGPLNAYPVRKFVDAGPLHWKLAVAVSDPDIVTVCGFVLPFSPPL